MFIPSGCFLTVCLICFAQHKLVHEAGVVCVPIPHVRVYLNSCVMIER